MDTDPIPEYYPYGNEDPYQLDKELEDREERIEQFKRTWKEIRLLPETTECNN